ncbi:MAG: response regulator [Actinomycetota bacterium]|nr:response regulator [Actinomycetota bacterium]
MKTDIRCADCGHLTAIEEGMPLVCAACGRHLDATIDLGGGGISQNPTVLIVDDEPDVRWAARTILMGHGFDVVGDVSNGPDAALVAAERRPTIVLLDQRMPAMTGEDTAKLLRRVSPASLIVSFSAVVGDRPHWADAALRKDQADRLPEVLHSVTRRSTGTPP